MQLAAQQKARHQRDLSVSNKGFPLLTNRKISSGKRALYYDWFFIAPYHLKRDDLGLIVGFYFTIQ